MAFTTIIDIFYQWERIGVFEYFLPFMLVFAIVYGILSSTRFMGDNKPVYVIISLAIGLMSLRFQGFLSTFMTVLFPNLGIGLTVLLTVIILVGLFVSENDARYWGYILAVIGILIAIAVIYNSFDEVGLIDSYGSEIVGYAFLVFLIIGAVIAVGLGDRPTKIRGGEAKYGYWRKGTEPRFGE